ncbi:cytochrome c biogenesis CcdA family protein [Geodermatophilus chilensis]|jgi:cytochrome c-type biogenesis protein|uniref:cytochrome c biogenesis CcdA family protein n=1 Tax=Geodermatophilus chilensis TaxID=2035835 RepID=UPI000C261671|nr:cytochrome c biogenesis protein CcdA [Geodermatophilus chilensis]
MDVGVFGLALVAGAVAAFNPCGFALLPAYLGLIVADARSARRAAVARAVGFALGMTTGFVVVFGLAGLALGSVTASVQRYLPVLTVLIGAVLVGVGLWLLTGRRLGLSGMAGHGQAPTARWASQVGFGVSFALASLSCTLAPFLAVTAGALRTGGPVEVAATFLVYALGMGTIVTVLSVAVALARTSIVGSLRRAGALISRGSGALLLVAGGYVAWYGWFEIRVLAGAASGDPVIEAASSVQGALTRWVAALGPGGLVAIGLIAAVGVAGAIRPGRRRARERQR